MSSEFTLIVAEKSSVARGIAAVVGAAVTHPGFITGDGVAVSWCRGHLLALDAPDSYGWKKWRAEDLPMIPDKWRYHVIDGAQTQYNTLVSLMRSQNCVKIVEATDSGREGELIFRTVYYASGSDKPVDRLWVSSLEPGAIREGLKNMKPMSDYDDLYRSAVSRQAVDWILGMNLTRYYTVTGGKLFVCGRVQTATAKLVADRDRLRTQFVPQRYYITTADIGFPVTRRAPEPLDTVILPGDTAVLTGSDSKRVKQAPPELFDLTLLQREMNRLYKIPAAKTLDILQALYLRQLVTYPRTGSRYITAAQEGSVRALIRTINPNYVPDLPRIINDAKVTDHHALLPTAAGLAAVDVSGDGRKILDAIIGRLIQATGRDCVYDSRTAVYKIRDLEFSASGTVMIDRGWRQDLPHGDLPEDPPETATVRAVRSDARLTEPPPAYTEDTLLRDMETCGRLIGDNDLRRSMPGLGTAATRAEIIERLIAVKYIRREAARLTATEHLYDFLSIVDAEIAQVDYTAHWEQMLSEIEAGKMGSRALIEDVTAKVTQICKADKA